jgi:hypothetical protein
MLRRLSLLGLLPFLMLSTPASALTSKQKMETCKIGANAQKLTGAQRKTFISRCMANEEQNSNATAAPSNESKQR